MWKPFATGLYEHDSKKYSQKKPNELAAVERNLAKFVNILNAGTKPLQMAGLKFVHNERKGVYAIDESGYKIKTQVARLYVWCEEPTELVHLITIGDKHSQSDDIDIAQDYVADQLKKAKLNNEPDTRRQEEPAKDGTHIR